MPTSETSETKKDRTFIKACFTCFKWPVEPEFSAKLRYLAYAHEICPTSGRDHWQGYAYANTPMRLKGWTKLFPKAHIEPMRGDFTDSKTYCSKEGKLIEHGKPPRQGERTDLQELKVQLDSGKRPLEIADEVDGMFGIVARTHRFSESYFQYKRAKKLANDRTVPEVYIRWGPPGSGKTRWMDDTYGAGNWSRAPDNTGKWFDGCDCDVILFDDVKVNEVPPIAQLLGLTDRYPIQVPVKGGFITWKPRVIVFTSNYKPREWWTDIADVSYKAFKRRVTKCNHITIKDAPIFKNAEVCQHIDI